MNKIKRILVYAGIMIYMVVMLGFISEKAGSIHCDQIRVIIADSLNNGFINDKDVWQVINENNLSLKGEDLYKINTKILEDNLLLHPAVKNAQAFKTINGKVNIYIDQRDPIIRIYTDRYSFYLDEEGNYIPLSRKFAAHVPIASGYIPADFDWQSLGSVDNLLKDSELDNNEKLMIDLYLLAKYIYENEFWKSMIEQVYINENQEFEMIPRVGSHVILFGEFKQVDEKFRNLKVLYKKGFNKVGWIKYESINLKYKDQIVCKKVS